MLQHPLGVKQLKQKQAGEVVATMAELNRHQGGYSVVSRSRIIYPPLVKQSQAEHIDKNDQICHLGSILRLICGDGYGRLWTWATQRSVLFEDVQHAQHLLRSGVHL